MNNNFFYLLINPAKKNTDLSVLKGNIVKDLFKKNVNKDKNKKSMIIIWKDLIYTKSL